MTNTEKYSKKHLAREVSEIERSGRIGEYPNLSVYEKALIFKYSYDGYEELNEHLRVQEGNNTTEFGILLDHCLTKLPNFEGLVYRGANLTRNELKKYKDGAESGTPIIEPTFVSTSKSRLIAMQFGANILFRIYSRKGKEIEKIAKFGKYNPPNEKEVLFRPNSSFRVLDEREQGNYTLITMEEI